VDRRRNELHIVHRDVKPENIFLCRSDEGFFVKLLDFGIAKQSRMPERSGLTAAGVMVGTAEYMSREQVLSSKDVDRRADLWALTVVAYEMLTGDVPFTGETLGMICVSICNAEFDPPSDKRKECGVDVDVWFAKALHKEPDQRFQSARELAETFRKALLGDDVKFDSFSDERLPREARPTGVGLFAAPERPPPLAGQEDEPALAALQEDEAPMLHAPTERSQSERKLLAELDLASASDDASRSSIEVTTDAVDLSPPAVSADPPAADESPIDFGADDLTTPPASTTIITRRGPPRGLWVVAIALVVIAVPIALFLRPQPQAPTPTSPASESSSTSISRPEIPLPADLPSAAASATSAVASAQPASSSVPVSSAPIQATKSSSDKPHAPPDPSGRQTYGF
jgi:serine/threonine protein kinase